MKKNITVEIRSVFAKIFNSYCTYSSYKLKFIYTKRDIEHKKYDLPKLFKYRK